MPEPRDPSDAGRRRFLLGSGALTGGLAAQSLLPAAGAAPPGADTQVDAPRAIASVKVSLKVNGRLHELQLDPRVTLLDLLRERLLLPGTKKGCDRGQCGACTVLVDGRRVNSCLALAVALDGAQVTTIEGLGTPGNLHPMQQAFLERDAFQCGYCTPGQICSAVAMLAEARAGTPSAVSEDVREHPRLTDAEIRERMSGNICRCGAYVNIVAAVRDVAGRGA